MEGRVPDNHPRKILDTQLTLDDFHSAVMSNPHHAYQKYVAAAVK